MKERLESRNSTRKGINMKRMSSTQSPSHMVNRSSYRSAGKQQRNVLCGSSQDLKPPVLKGGVQAKGYELLKLDKTMICSLVYILIVI